MANWQGIIPVFIKHIPDKWNENYYALAVTDRLGLEGKDGMVRVGPVHYNTVDEIEKFGKALSKVAALR